MIPVLMYHEVNKKKQSSRRFHPSCYLPAKKFEEQMSYLYENNFYSLSPLDFLRLSTRKDTIRNSGKPFLITFDDGHVGNYEDALPILKKYGFCAIFFVAIDFIGQHAMLSWEQLKEMSEADMSIQSHGVSHKPFTSLSHEQIKDELKISKEIIEKKLITQVDFLSLPHGDFNKRIEKIARQIGYRAIFTSNPGYLTEGPRDFFVERIDIRQNYSMDYFISLVEGDGRWSFKLSKIVNTLKSNVRSAIGVNNYRKFYRLFNKIKLGDSSDGRE